jgi:hypothetical protein
MHWLSQNYQWIFSGIGVLILGLLIERRRRLSKGQPEKENSAALTAQGAKVMDSPVASGSNISQKVNSPTINLSLPATTASVPGGERYGEWRELIHELHESLQQMGYAFLPMNVITPGDETNDYAAGIRRGYRVLRNRILIGDVLKDAGMLDKFDEIVKYAISAQSPRDQSQRGCPTMVGFDMAASKFNDEVVELARKDSGSAATQSLDTTGASQHRQQAPEPPTMTRPLPSRHVGIKFVGARLTQIAQADYGLWREERFSGVQALVMEFTNEAQKGVPNFGRTIKASLLFSDDTTERLRVGAACWINEQSDWCNFGTEETHTLLLGIVAPRKFATISKRRKYGDMGAEILQMDEHILAGFEHGFVRVRLTDPNSGELVFEDNFELSFNPLKIVPGQVAAPPTTAAQPAAVKPKYVEPLPNVKYISAEVTCLREQFGGGLSEEEGKPNALLIRFANEARQDSPNLTARLKAVIIYRYGQTEIDVAGSWLSEASDVAEFAPDSRRHKLIAGVLVDGQLGAITSRTFVAHRRNWYMSDRLDLKGFKEGILVVQLMDVTRGTHLLYKGEFVIVTNPLAIFPKTS